MTSPVLVCFAVRQESRPFARLTRGRSDVHVLVTGMGARNAERSVRLALEDLTPVRVISSGFAGGLDPVLLVGDVVFDAEGTSPRAVAVLRAAGAIPVRFASSDTVASTAAAKSELRDRTRADAVEMESVAIRSLCVDHEVACTTVRVISDSADQDLPLDFNALMTPADRLSPVRLAWAIGRSPRRIPGLVRLGSDGSRAAERLAEVLLRLV